MNFIDISSWQAGMDLAAMFEANHDLDGVIVKLTEGIGYVNPQAGAWINWLRAHGKPFGTYHFLDGYDAKTEAQHYARTLAAYPGGVPTLDYEAEALQHGTGYLKECLDEFARLTGVKPLVYCSQSVTQQQDFTAIAAAGYKLWVAQYADMAPVRGFLDKPWQSGSVAPFGGFVMQQYTSQGYLPGWSGNLDFDQFRGSSDDWSELAAGQDPAPERQPADPIVVGEVLCGRYGVGADRVQRLIAAGYDPESVQAKVNECYGIAQSCKRFVAGNEAYMNNIVFIIRLL